MVFLGLLGTWEGLGQQRRPWCLPRAPTRCPVQCPPSGRQRQPHLSHLARGATQCHLCVPQSPPRHSVQRTPARPRRVSGSHWQAREQGQHNPRCGTRWQPCLEWAAGKPRQMDWLGEVWARVGQLAPQWTQGVRRGQLCRARVLASWVWSSWGFKFVVHPALPLQPSPLPTLSRTHLRVRPVPAYPGVTGCHLPGAGCPWWPPLPCKFNRTAGPGSGAPRC